MSLFTWFVHLFPVEHYRAEVEPGVLWRGSRLEPEEMKRLIAPPAAGGSGIRSIVSLNAEDPEGDLPVLRKVGLSERDVHLDRHVIEDYTAPSPAQIDRFLAWVRDARNQPCLVHCRAGKGRTGVMVACFRVERGMPLAQALEEAARYGMNRKSQVQAVVDFATRGGAAPGRTSPQAAAR